MEKETRKEWKERRKSQDKKSRTGIKIRKRQDNKSLTGKKKRRDEGTASCE